MPQARRRKPQRVGLDRAHQPAGDAEADQRAAERQHGEALGQAEHQRAERGNAEQRRQHAARAVTVEQHTERQLERGEGEKVRRGEQAEVGGREREFGRQFARDDRVDVAEEVRQEIARGERAEHHEHQLRGQSVVARRRPGHAGIVVGLSACQDARSETWNRAG